MGHLNQLLVLMLLGLQTILRLAAGSTRGQREQVCYFDTFSPICPPNNVINMEEALYGKMDPRVCDEDGKDTDYSECTSNVLGLTDSMCSGKQRCEVAIPHEGFERAIRCSTKRYFEGTYSCLAVTKLDRLCKGDGVLQVSHQTQTITSDDIAKTYCVRNRRGMIEVKAKPGQQINITLIDFMWGAGTPSRSGCVGYGQIVDQQTGRQTRICGDEQREKNLLLSISSTVFIKPEPMDSNVRFLLKLQALGCEDMAAPNGAWMNRSHDRVTLGCQGSSQVWEVRCVRGKWVGHVGECMEVPVYQEEAPVAKSSMPLPNDIIIALIAAATFLVAVLIVTTGVIYFKRAQRRQLILQQQQKNLFVTLRRKMEENTEEATYMSPGIIQHEVQRGHRPESAYESIHVFNRPLSITSSANNTLSVSNTVPRRVDEDTYNASQSSSSTYTNPQKYFVLDKNLVVTNAN